MKNILFIALLLPATNCFGQDSFRVVGINDDGSLDRSIPATSGLCSAVLPPVALLDAYQSSFHMCYASYIMENCRICNKYFEGTEMNGVETLYYA